MKKFDGKFSRFDTIRQRDRQTHTGKTAKTALCIAWRRQNVVTICLSVRALWSLLIPFWCSNGTVSYIVLNLNCTSFHLWVL